MIEKYLKDSITEPDRKAMIDRIADLNLIPKRMLDAMRERDSIARAKSKNAMLAKDYIKSIKDTTGMEDVDSTDAMEELNKIKANDKKTDSLPAKKQNFSNNKPNAILPDRQSKKEEN
jgi:hypothetical protein